MTAEQKLFFEKGFHECAFSEDMKKHTTFKIGGNAEAFISCVDTDELKTGTAFCREQGIPYFIIGNGSNILVSDEGIDGVVFHIGRNMGKISVSGTKIYAESGCLLSVLSNYAMKKSLSGLEFAAGIPGTLGGGIYMNAGAYGGELKDVVINVDYLDSNGVLRQAHGRELDFSYRHSMFSDNGYIIVGCELELKNGKHEEIKSLMQEYNKRRSDKQPLEYPSAGSTFKRPEGYFAGKLIQDSGLQGSCIGGACVSEKHAGFIINKGGATAADVLELVGTVQNAVMEKFGVELETEIKFIGR